MKKHVLAGALLLGSTIGLLSGCGGNNKWVDGKYNISISARSDAAEQEMLNIWKKAYEAKNPNVNVIIEKWGGHENAEEYVRAYSMMRDKLTNMTYVTDDYVSVLATKHNFVDLRPYFEADLAETDYSFFYESMLNTTSYSGDFRPTTNYKGDFVRHDADGNVLENDNDREYGVYFSPREYNMPAIVCNKDAFAKIGIEIPSKENWDFDAFVNLLQRISNKINELIASGNNWANQYRGIELNQTWEPIYTTLMKHFDSDGLFIKNSKGETVSNLGSEKNREIYKKLIEAFGQNNFNKAVDQDFTGVNFLAGNILMATASYPEVGNFIKSSTSKNISFLPFPTDYVGAGCGGYGILTDKAEEVQTVNGVSKKTVDLCWDFIKFTISEEGQNVAGKDGYIQPFRKSLATTGEWLNSIDPSLDHSAFACKKELSLNVYNFAEPVDRQTLRTGINKLFTEIFRPEASVGQINGYINTANEEIKKVVPIE